jgi:ABC-type methionine transport system ATPase subunit
MSHNRLIHCTFPKDLIHEPLLYNLGVDFGVVPNIRGATISDDIGLVYLDLVGKEAEVEKAVQYLKSRGVAVEEVTDSPEEGQAPGTSS